MRAAASQSSGLSLSWALGQLRKQLGESTLDSCLHKPHGPQAARPDECQTFQGSLTALSCATPTSSDTATNMQQNSHAASSSSGTRAAGVPLSVHWAEALEQHTAPPHAPQHAHHAPDKPCLKTQRSSFPYVEQAAQLDGLLCRPWAGSMGSGGSDGAPVLKKRSRMAAFGQ